MQMTACLEILVRAISYAFVMRPTVTSYRIATPKSQRTERSTGTFRAKRVSG